VAGQLENLEKVIKVSREKYTKPRSVVEEKIIRWSTNRERESAEEQRAVSQQPPRQIRPDFKETPRREDYRRQDFSKKPKEFERRERPNVSFGNRKFSDRPETSKNKDSQINRLTEIIEKEIPPAVTLMEALKKGPATFKEKKAVNRVIIKEDEPEKNADLDSEDNNGKKLNRGQIIKF